MHFASFVHSSSLDTSNTYMLTHICLPSISFTFLPHYSALLFFLLWFFSEYLPHRNNVYSLLLYEVSIPSKLSLQLHYYPLNFFAQAVTIWSVSNCFILFSYWITHSEYFVSMFTSSFISLITWISYIKISFVFWNSELNFLKYDLNIPFFMNFLFSFPTPSTQLQSIPQYPLIVAQFCIYFVCLTRLTIGDIFPWNVIHPTSLLPKSLS